MAEVGTLTYRLDIDDNGFDRQLDDSREKVKDLGDEGKKTDKKLSGALDNIVRGPLRDFKREISSTANVTRSLQIAFSGFRGAALVGAVTIASGALIELVGAALAASGALLALPAAAAVAAGAFAAVRVATIGMEDAFDAVAKGDAEKLQEALNNLSPAAQRFVLAVKDLKDAFDPIRRVVQDALFQGLDKELNRLAFRSLPVVREGLLRVSRSLNTVAIRAAETVRQPFFQGFLDRSLSATARAVDTLSGAVNPLAQVIDRLVAVGEPFIQQLAEWITRSLQSAAAFLQTETGVTALQTRLAAGLDVLGQIGALLGAVTTAIVNLFRVSDSSGQTLIETLTDMVNQFNTFLTSAEGQKSFHNFFKFANQVLRESLIIIGAVVGVLLSVINAISALPQPAQDFIAKLVALGIVLTPVILGIATLVNSIVALGPVIRFASVLFNGLIVTAFRFGTVVLQVAIQVGALLLRLGTQALLAGGRIALGFLIAMGPIGIIIAAVAALAVIIFLNFNRIRDFIVNVWNNVSSFLAGVWTRIRDGASNALNSITEFVRSIPSRLLDALGNVGGLLFNAGRDILNGLGNGIQSAVDGVKNRLKDFAKGALDTIKGFFGIRSPSRVMAQMGRFMMEGLARGIQSGTSQAVGAATRASEAALGGFSTGTVNGPSLSVGAATAIRTTPSDSLSASSSSASTSGGAQPVVINLNMSGIMTRSRADQRAVAKDLVESINEELRSRRLPEIGNGALAA